MEIIYFYQSMYGGNIVEKKRLFVDMDGTLAVFKQVDALEKLYEEGYFYNLKPQVNILEAVREIILKNEIEVFIMSAVLSDSQYALQEKARWLDRHLPELNANHRIFLPCGEDKKKYIPGGVQETDCLLDDYTKNLVLWEPPARGIKLLNGINGTHGSWKRNAIAKTRHSNELSEIITKIVCNNESIRDDGIDTLNMKCIKKTYDVFKQNPKEWIDSISSQVNSEEREELLKWAIAINNRKIDGGQEKTHVQNHRLK